MLARLPSSVLTEYMALHSFDPIGEERADLRAGIIAATVANHSMSPPNAPARPLDFMPFAKAEEALQVADREQHAKIVQATLFADGSVKDMR